jgi:hypothetical protein
MIRKLLLAGVILLLAVGTAGATTLLKMSFGDLARESDRIVVGTVTGIEGEWDPTLNFIRSNVTLDVEQSLRGQSPDTIVLRNPGGYVGGMAQTAQGVAEFEVGERVVVFLTTWADGTPKVLGYVQGKSRVVVDGQGRERLVGGSGNGLTLAGAVREIHDGPDHNIPLRPAN